MHATTSIATFVHRQNHCAARGVRHHVERRSGFRSCLRPRSRTNLRGFSLTELLVVIGIIILLAGLLLAALHQVRERSMRAKTEWIMQQFANACAAFHADHGRFPGVIPDDALANPTGTGALSSTENALLDLIGGWRLLKPGDDIGNTASPAVAEFNAFRDEASDADADVQMRFTNSAGEYHLVIDLRKLGEGPRINGKSYNAYLSAGAVDMLAAKGQINPNGSINDDGIPDLLDAWGQPIIYIRRVRDRGPLRPDPTTNVAEQFPMAGVNAYLRSTELGEFGKNQVYDAGNNFVGSVLSAGTPDQQNALMAAVLAHPAMYNPNAPIYSSPRGDFMLWSAGPDGVFLSAMDGPDNDNDPSTPPDLGSLIQGGPKLIDEYDDIRSFGG